MANGKQRKSLIGKAELALILGAVLAVAAFLLLRGRAGPGGTACVTVHGARVLELPLAQTEDCLIRLEEYGVPASLEIKDHKIRFVNVACPDHICEKTGWVWRDGQSAVCMPNRTSVVIVE